MKIAAIKRAIISTQPKVGDSFSVYYATKLFQEKEHHKHMVVTIISTLDSELGRGWLARPAHIYRLDDGTEIIIYDEELK